MNPDGLIGLPTGTASSPEQDVLRPEKADDGMHADGSDGVDAQADAGRRVLDCDLIKVVSAGRGDVDGRGAEQNGGRCDGETTAHALTHVIYPPHGSSRLEEPVAKPVSPIV